MRNLILIFLLVSQMVSCGKKNSTDLTSNVPTSNSYEQKIPGSNTSIVFAVSRTGLLWSQLATNKISTILDSGLYSHLVEFDLDQNDLMEVGCPKYNTALRAEKVAFWVAYLATISNIESGYATNFWIWDRLHKKTSGLLMVSSEDADKYLRPITGINYSMSKLLDPSLNIETGIGLLYLQLSGQLNNQSSSNKLFYFDNDTLWPTVGLSLRTDKVEFMKLFGFYTSQFSWCK